MGFRVRSKIGEAVVCAGIAVFGGLMMLGSYRMPMGVLAMPGPGFLPMALGVLLLALGCLLAVRSMVDRPADTTDVELVNRDIVVVLISLGWIGFTLETLGAEASFAGFLLICLRAHASLKWFVAALASVVFSLMTCWIFRVVLGVNLPSGIFGP